MRNLTTEEMEFVSGGSLIELGDVLSNLNILSGNFNRGDGNGNIGDDNGSEGCCDDDKKHC